jgi:hypothetical protein
MVGRFAYAIDTGGPDEPELDFALVRLTPGVEASPQMCHWGGPTGLNTDLIPPPTPITLRYYGQGIGFGELTPARSAVALGTPDSYQVLAWGATIFGDSGTPVISSDGRAIGVVHGAGAGQNDSAPGHSGTMIIVRLAPVLERAERALGTVLSLETAPLMGP